ncbi:MAG: hypothetical protein M3Z26_15610 [Bacteroidota bacterium]|nr:hypothetical protein [Bacteroidota bacterium]
MKKFFTTTLVFFILTQTFGQTQRKISTYLFAQYDKTLYDITLGNNPWGAGLGIQAFLNIKTKFKLTIEVAHDIYLEDDKLLRLDSTGHAINDFRDVTNLFAGLSFHPSNDIYISFLTGPSFINGRTILGIKPSFGFYFSKKQKWTGKISYINIFKRDKATKGDFGSLAFAVGLKLF